ncbi:6-phosphogluconolactonase [Bifidobacterium mongoliense]|uniref:6-phosphogluconolactonase n=1 Tax=Bifidobacterium mongoliense TaxID=518643 RepID=UPI002A75AF76|nr:6-phosphogluconolactonase [Bifidobacterium mongoliense]MDY3125447.1 6-phosphogluconolactonase [Bifidobacterium mongoliense]
MVHTQRVVYPHTHTIAEAGAQRILLAILDGLNGRPEAEWFDLALTGGSDTLKALQYMADNPLADAIDWSRVRIWWADERFVAADDDDRNAFEARRLLLDHLVSAGMLPEANIHEMGSDTRSPAAVAAADDAADKALLDEAARAYERELVEALGPEPAMDLLVLGMGPDGHYASLFPGHPQIGERERLVVGVDHSPKLPPLRLSMTAPLMARSRRTWVLTAGSGKAEALARALAEPNNPATPASFATGTEECIWFTEPSAAAGVPETGTAH